MKLIYTFIFILCLNNLFSQTGDITYIVTPKSTTELSEKQIKLNNEIELMTFNLLYNNEKSFYKKNKNVPIDDLQAKFASIFVNGFVEYFHFLKSKNVIYNEKINSKMYQVTDTIKINNWKLLNETINIKDYKCYKAILTIFNERAQKDYNIIAWYSPEIPVPFGPGGYGGLPGLILQLENNYGFIISAESIVLNKKNVKIPILESGPQVSVKQKLILKRKERKVTED